MFTNPGEAEGGAAMAELQGARDRASWPAMYAAWRAGASVPALAEKYGFNTAYLADGLRAAGRIWPDRLASALGAAMTRELLEAAGALEEGEPGTAEKRARALTALIKAAEALDGWRERAQAAAKDQAMAGIDARDKLEAERRDFLERLERAVRARCPEDFVPSEQDGR